MRKGENKLLRSEEMINIEYSIGETSPYDAKSENMRKEDNIL
jgi:hypothetical protein